MPGRVEIGKKDWTVLVYQGGVNNLDDSLHKNLLELAKAPQPSNVDILVRQMDRAGQGQDLHVEDHALVPVSAAAPVESAKGSTLADFVRLGMEKYPASHYLLVVSSHGKGAEGVVEDERQARMMSLPEMRAALESVGRPIHVVFFDACRMQSVEMASELKGVVQVSVASLDRIDSAGYDPARLISSAGASADALELGKRLVENQDPRQLNDFVTLSAVDLRQLGPLERALGDLSRELGRLPAEQAQRVREIVTFSRRSLPSPAYQDALSNMAQTILSGSSQDLQGWLEEVRPTDPVAILSLCRDLVGEPGMAPALVEAARAVAAAHDLAVFAQRTPECDGLSVMLPLERKTDAVPDLAFEQATHWQEGVRNIVPLSSPAPLGKSWLEVELGL